MCETIKNIDMNFSCYTYLAYVTSKNIDINLFQ